MSKLPQKHVENSGLNHGICLKQKIQSFKYQCGNSVRRIPGGSHKNKAKWRQKRDRGCVKTLAQPFFMRKAQTFSSPDFVIIRYLSIHISIKK